MCIVLALYYLMIIIKMVKRYLLLFVLGGIIKKEKAQSTKFFLNCVDSTCVLCYNNWTMWLNVERLGGFECSTKKFKNYSLIIFNSMC